MIGSPKKESIKIILRTACIEYSYPDTSKQLEVLEPISSILHGPAGREWGIEICDFALAAARPVGQPRGLAMSLRSIVGMIPALRAISLSPSCCVSTWSRVQIRSRAAPGLRSKSLIAEPSMIDEMGSNHWIKKKLLFRSLIGIDFSIASRLTVASLKQCHPAGAISSARLRG